jgi:cell wall-associated NlpC family hydrolase
LKRLSYILLILLVFSACKPTSDIITSKKDAETKGLYNKPQTRTAYANRDVPLKAASQIESRKRSKKSRLNEKNDDDYKISTENTSYLVKQLINEASEELGANYRSGGITPQGYDCSGLMYATFLKFDITLPRSSVDMAKIGKKLDNDEIQKGDLIFFKTNGKHAINHVGMVLEVNSDEIKFIHSSTQRGVIISLPKRHIMDVILPKPTGF